MLNIIRRFFKKNDRNNGNTKDTHVGCNHIDLNLGDVTLALSKRKQISFQLVECVRCGDRRGVPNNNVNIAFERGTKDTLDRLNRLGLNA